MDPAGERRHQGADRDLTMSFPILQFGTSRFLQAHVDLFVSEALPRGEAMGHIVAVQTTANPASRRRIEAFAKGTPYPVKIRGVAQGAVVDREIEVDSVRGGVDANENWAEVERLFIRARCAISNTADRGYETDAADRPNGPVPRSFPAKLARLLVARHRAGAPPITLFPCELTPANGDTLRAIVLDILAGWEAPEAARRWVGEQCVWVNSLVDRIVSAPLEPFGAIAEPYALWAIENRPGLEPPCRHADVVVTDDLKRYERLKLFLLNLGHTWLAERWRKSNGAPELTVREAMADASLRASLDEIFEREALPVFAGIGMGEEARRYRDTVIERFSNPFLDHRLAEIYNNHAAKKARRFGGLIALARGLGVNQPKLAAALAADGGNMP
jgi:tagaturonate reductase